MTQTALITGASGGIGWELEICFSRHGHELVLVVRTEEKLRRPLSGTNRKWFSKSGIAGTK